MNHYEEKQEARRQRYLDRAEAARENSRALGDEAREMASAIPLGQPIHVGHYSEKRDRAYRARIDRKYERAIRELDKAKHYEEKADAVGRGGISSDDPDALEKLKEKLRGLEQGHAIMLAVNRAVRKTKDDGERLRMVMAAVPGLGEEAAREALIPRHQIMGYAEGYPPYCLRNSLATIKATKHRIASLEAVATMQAVEEKGRGYTYKVDPEANRIMFIFDEKPNKSVTQMMRSRGFVWSPRAGAWQRKITANGRYAASLVRQELDA